MKDILKTDTEIILQSTHKRTQESLLAGGFIGDPNTTDTASPFLRQFTKEEEKYGALDVMKSAFVTENTLFSANGFNVGNQEIDDDFDPITPIMNTKYEDFIDEFEGVINQDQFERLQTKIDNELAHRQVINDAGGFGIVSSMVAGALDPINLIPVGGSAYKTYKAGGVIKGALQAGKIGLGSSILSETILQDQQVTRTGLETTFNITGSTLLSGLIGAGAGALSKKQFNKLADELSSDIQRLGDRVELGHDGSLSAAKTPKQEGGELKPALGLEKISKFNPIIRVLNSGFVTAEKILPKLVRTNMYFKKNAEGLATEQSVEIAIKQYDTGLANGITQNRKNFKTYKKKGGKLNFKQFNDEVSLAMIRNDLSDIPEVQKSAQNFRKEIFDNIKNEGIKVQLFDEDIAPKTAPSYLMRQYNRQKIIAKERQFKQIIKDGAMENLVPKIKDQLGDEDDILDFVNDVADNVYNNILGYERKGIPMPYDLKIAERGPAKERVLNFVKDEDLRPFLETNIEKIAKNYVRILAPDIELKRTFGDLNLKKELDEIKAEAQQQRIGKSEKEIIAINKKLDDTLTTINSLKDILRGQYGLSNNPDALIPRILQASRTMQYLSKLGGVTISSIPDTARHIMVHGVGRVFNKGLRNLITNTKGIKLALKDAKLSGNLLENITSQRAMLYADLGDPYSNRSSFENMLQAFSEGFSKWNGLNLWNNTQKSFSSILTQQRMIENINNYSKIKPKEREYMAFLGIDKNNIPALKKQLKEFSSKEGNLDIANLEKWKDDKALRIYKNALNTDVDRTIVTKGAGDVPLMMNTELGKTIGQFKSFALSAHQQVLIAGLQQRDMASLNGLVTMIAFGMLTYHLKTQIAGRETSDDPNIWLVEGIDRSGIMPVIMEASNMLGLTDRAVGQPLSRYASRNSFGKLLGPSFGAGQDAFQLKESIFNGELTESDIKAIRRNIPMQNIFYLRWLFNELEK